MARWAAWATSVRLASGMPSASSRACATGVAGSFRPATTRVDAVVATTQGQGGKDRDQLAGLTVPVKLSGPLDDMKYQVDYAAVASGIAKSKVGERAKEQVQQRRDKIEDQVRDRLKGLLGR